MSEKEERRVNVGVLANKVESLEEAYTKGHEAFHGMQEKISILEKNSAVQDERQQQILKSTQKIELCLTGKEGSGGLLGEINDIKVSANRWKGYLIGASGVLSYLSKYFPKINLP